MVRELLSEYDPELIIIDGYDSAILGVCERAGQQDSVLYSSSKIVQILIERDTMTEEDALEFLDFNIINAYMGEKTPTFLFMDD